MADSKPPAPAAALNKEPSAALNKKPPDKLQLRTFGLMFSGIVVAIFAVAVPFLADRAVPVWPWVIAAVMISFSTLRPGLLIYLYKPWLKFGAIAGWINTRIILFVLFYGLITPIALIMRLFGSDPLRRRFDSNSDSYRISTQTQTNDHMEKPY
jgi:hypothetical protein